MKAIILHSRGEIDQAKAIINRVPIIYEGSSDPVTFHNQAILFSDENSTESIKKLNFLLHSNFYPPETFSNLLFFYCKFFFYDLANELITEN